jgi:hypothetical protein
VKLFYKYLCLFKAIMLLFLLLLAGCGGASPKEKQQQLTITSSSPIAGFEVAFQKPLPSSVILKFDSIGVAANVLNRLSGGAQEYLVYLPKVGVMPLNITSNPLLSRDVQGAEVVSVHCVDRTGNDVFCKASWVVLNND